MQDANTYVRTAGREVSGIELVENGTFDSDVSGWTAIPHLLHSNGKIVVDRNGETNPDKIIDQKHLYNLLFQAGFMKYTVDVVDDGSVNGRCL